MLVFAAGSARAQPRARSWYEGVWEVDGQTVLVLTVDQGREVRAGAGRSLRHGRWAPLVVRDAPPEVRFVSADLPTAGSRWVLRREGDGLVLEEWIRSGGASAPWRMLRSVRRGHSARSVSASPPPSVRASSGNVSPSG